MRELIEQNKVLRRFLDLARITIVVLDNKGDITLLNKKGYETLGYEEGEVNKVTSVIRKGYMAEKIVLRPCGVCLGKEREDAKS